MTNLTPAERAARIKILQGAAAYWADKAAGYAAFGGRGEPLYVEAVERTTAARELARQLASE